MKIEYENKSVEKLFIDLNDSRGSMNLMKKLIGAELTRSVKKRYDQIVAFSSFYSLQKSGFGKMESLSGKMKDSYSLRLTANYRLIVRPKSESRSSEMLMQCDTLIIEGVVDYHGSDRKYNWLIP